MQDFDNIYLIQNQLATILAQDIQIGHVHVQNICVHNHRSQQYQ